MHAALQRGWPLAMVIQIHQKVGDLGEGSTHTTYEEGSTHTTFKEDKEEENVQATEPEPEP